MCKGFLPPFESTRACPLMCQNLSADMEKFNLTTCQFSTKEAADCPKQLRSTSLYPAYITGRCVFVVRPLRLGYKRRLIGNVLGLRRRNQIQDQSVTAFLCFCCWPQLLGELCFFSVCTILRQECFLLFFFLEALCQSCAIAFLCPECFSWFIWTI